MFTQLLSLSTGQSSFYLSTGANSYMLILGHKKESMHKIVYITNPLRWGSWYFYNCNSIPFIGKGVLLTLMHWKCEKPTYAPWTAFKSVFCSSFPPSLCWVAVTSTHPNQALSAAFFLALGTASAVLHHPWHRAGLLQWRYQTQGKGEKQHEEPGSHLLADVSDIQRRGWENPKKVDIWRRHAVLHA